jgi:hypothetical protein
MRIADRRRALHSAFHEYVRGVFAETDKRSHALRATRVLWLRGLASGMRRQLVAKLKRLT